MPSLLVDRGDALLIATVAEAAAPEGYPRDEQLRGVVPVTAMLFTEAFVVRGTMHKRPDLALPEALERITDDFVPLSNVQIFPLLGGIAPIARDFAALALARIVALYEVGAPAPAAPPVPPAVPAEALEENSVDGAV